MRAPWLSLSVGLFLACRQPAVTLDGPEASGARAPSSAEPRDAVGFSSTRPPPVRGFADLHVHQFSEYAFGGAWFWGKAEGLEAQALAPCGGGSVLGGDHARTTLGPLNELLAKVPGSDGDTGLHAGKANGFPKYEGWPRWDTIAHQQVWEGQLRSAHERGLSLMVMSAVNFRPLCELMPAANRTPGRTCQDMEAVDLQLEAAHRFDRDHEWFEIAYGPADARRIISEGKLAVILAIEVSELFGDADWRAQLARYHAAGVRSLQLAHQVDNRFSGVAPHHWVFKLFEYLQQGGFTLDAEGKNVRGLTVEGAALVEAMMEKGMLIDLAHLSERAVQDVVELSRHQGYYPLFLSHGHFRSVMTDAKQKEEKTSPDWVVKALRESGGVFGLRTGSEQVKSYPASGVPNDCDGSTKSFAQAYAYGALGLKVDVAFASDFNGFIQQLRPRFGGEAESCGASGDGARRKAQQALQGDRRGTALDTAGFGHIGLEPDVLDELKAFGVDTSSLEGSSERVVGMWERALDRARAGPLSAAGFDPAGIQAQ